MAGLSITPAGGAGTVTSVSVTTANGVSGSVATATTTPAITLSLDSTTRLSSKVITSLRDLTAASGDVAYTGVGFTPTAIQAIAVVEESQVFSIGFSDSAKTNTHADRKYDNLFRSSGHLIFGLPSAGAYQSAIVKSYDADGFTLTWTKTSSPSGTLNLYFLCFK